MIWPFNRKPAPIRQAERDYLAELEADRQRRLASFEVQDFTKRRAAALMHRAQRENSLG